ncbi:cell death abnormality protein 1-like [Ostrea edulis]|uniref:cell death abnormality protein 1-like n=1 Tax=Ostrea edulis TaxID=37623 RepID=UPI0024AEC1B3|nr:cell death abnormality protein 1-like [Ostrea edulis]
MVMGAFRVWYPRTFISLASDESLLAISEGYISYCKRGYIGDNCHLPCRYPNYGVFCQLECNCNESYCNHKHGCIANRDRPGEAQAESKQNTHATNRCKSTEDTKGRKVLVYLTVVLGAVGLLQLAVYIGLSILYEPRVLTSKRPSKIAQGTRT